MHRLLLAALLVAACSTGPEAPLSTVLVRFGQAPTDADIAALEAVGGTLQHRIDLARAVSMRSETSVVNGYSMLPGVRAVGDLGPEENPDVSVFITTAGRPTPEDSAFVRAAGARSAHRIDDEQTISAVMPLDRVAELEARVRFVSVEISIEPYHTQNAAALAAAAATQETQSVFITYRSSAPAGRSSAVIALGARSAHDVAEERTISAVMPTDAVERIRQIPWVERVEVSRAEPLRISADLVTWGIDSTRVLPVHAAPGFRGAGIRIGVLDTRIQCSHVDLRDRIAGGYDFVDGASGFCSPGTYYGFPSHATAVAGIIAGSRNGVGVLGVAPEASLYALRVCDDSGECQAANIWPALLWARKAGVQVVNLSLGNCGGGIDWRIADGLRRLIEAKIVVVASAGNGTLSGCPDGSPVSSIAAHAGVIGVSHWLQNGTQNPSFQYGPEVDIAAPAQVETADPAIGVNTSRHQGTSYSAPHVTGAVALLLQAGFSGPDLVLRRLAESAVDRGPAGWDDHWGAGTLDVQYAAVARPFIRSFTGANLVTESGTHTLRANITNGAPPFSVTWAVSYSDPGVHASYTYVGGTSYDVPIPEGRYGITIRATPKETVYGRSGPASTVELSVCTSGGGEVMSQPLDRSVPSVRTEALAGAC